MQQRIMRLGTITPVLITMQESTTQRGTIRAVIIQEENTERRKHLWEANHRAGLLLISGSRGISQWRSRRSNL